MKAFPLSQLILLFFPNGSEIWLQRALILISYLQVALFLAHSFQTGSNSWVPSVVRAFGFTVLLYYRSNHFDEKKNRSPTLSSVFINTDALVPLIYFFLSKLLKTRIKGIDVHSIYLKCLAVVFIFMFRTGRTKENSDPEEIKTTNDTVERFYYCFHMIGVGSLALFTVSNMLFCLDSHNVHQICAALIRLFAYLGLHLLSKLSADTERNNFFSYYGESLLLLESLCNY